MKIRRFSAHYVYTGLGAPLKNGIVEVDEQGTILSVVAAGAGLRELHSMEFHAGVLVPGFVNAHCHLELSHLRAKVPQHTGLTAFVSLMGRVRQAHEQQIDTAMRSADAHMHQQGIVAVGDICNSAVSVDTKRKSRMHYQSFVELFGLAPERAEAAVQQGADLVARFGQQGLAAMLSPHAAYSISRKLFGLLAAQMAQHTGPLSFHNQESAQEGEWFEQGAGAMREAFRQAGFPVEAIVSTGKSSLLSCLPYFPPARKLLLVHNTYTQAQDVQQAQALHPQLYWVLCPNANLYIENQLPQVPMLQQHGLRLALGTDSLAANAQLSILEEMKTLHHHFPDIPFAELLTWACRNGAEALDLQDSLGTIEPGKRPGLVLLEGFDFDRMHLYPDTTARRLA